MIVNFNVKLMFNSMLIDSLDNDDTVIGIFLDLQKTFDTVKHDILLYKMYNYGIRGVAYKWFVSYLSNRKQYTFMKDVFQILVMYIMVFHREVFWALFYF